MQNQSQSFNHAISFAGDFLEHYGVLGMHWGKRKGKSSPSGSSRRSVKKDTSSEDHKTKVKLKKKKLHELSNEELKTLNNRLQLERSYKDLTKSDISPGKKFVRDMATDIGKNLVRDAITSAIKSPFENKGSKKGSSSIAKARLKKDLNK